MSSDRVEVSRGLLVGLILLCAVSLLTLAFLLGRESKGEVAVVRETPAVATPAPPVSQEQVDLRGERIVAQQASPMRTVTVAPAPPSLPEAPPPPPAPAAPRTPAAAAPPRTPAPPPAPAVDPAMQERVRSYLLAMDACVGAAATWDNPEAIAQAALSQGSEGNSEGFDRVIRANREALQRMRAVSAPSPCARHHALAVQVMERGIGMVERLRTATLAQDTAPLAALATEGQELQARIGDLAELERQIRRDYALPQR